jgi:hypothetical protein
LLYVFVVVARGDQERFAVVDELRLEIGKAMTGVAVEMNRVIVDSV